MTIQSYAEKICPSICQLNLNNQAEDFAQLCSGLELVLNDPDFAYLKIGNAQIIINGIQLLFLCLVSIALAVRMGKTCSELFWIPKRPCPADLTLARQFVGLRCIIASLLGLRSTRKK
jgi:hypothetical protein